MTQWGWKSDPDGQRVGENECWQGEGDVLGEMGGWLCRCRWLTVKTAVYQYNVSLNSIKY